MTICSCIYFLPTSMDYLIISNHLGTLVGVTPALSHGTKILGDFFCITASSAVRLAVCAINSVIITSLPGARCPLASLKAIWGGTDLGALIDANPWLNDAAQQPLDGGSAPWRRVIKGWDSKVSDVPVNAVLNLFNVVLKNGCLWRN